MVRGAYLIASRLQQEQENYDPAMGPGGIPAQPGEKVLPMLKGTKEIKSLFKAMLKTFALPTVVNALYWATVAVAKESSSIDQKQLQKLKQLAFALKGSLEIEE